MTERRKILIVDDDPHIRKLLRLYLRSADLDVFDAATGEEALSLFDQHDFHTILLDLILPYLGGFRLCQKFKGRAGKSPRVIIMTADDSAETRATAADCGADGFLAKPFDASMVREMVSS